MTWLGRAMGSAGNVLSGYDAAVDKQRTYRENQLRVEEANRLAQMKARLASEPTPAFQPVDVASFGAPVSPGQPMGVEQVAPAAAPAGVPTAPVAPGAAQSDLKATLAELGVEPAASTVIMKAAQENRPLTQAEKDRIALMRVPTAVLDVVQAPAAAGIKYGSQLLAGLSNLGGRVVNAVTGQQTLPTDRQGLNVSMTPFYDRYVRTPEQAAGLRTQPAAPSGPSTPVPSINFPALAAAVEQVESGGREDAVSPKGAVGPMQTMPKTLKDPGFGVAPAKNDSPEELRRVGQDYLQAMLGKYKGNLDHALVAYNWGPTNADRWIAAGADPSKLPKETQDYIPKVKAAMQGGDAPQQTAAATAAAPSSPVAMPQTQRENITMAESYLANPESIPFEMQRINELSQRQMALLTQQRNETARLAQIMMQSGTSTGIQNAMAMRDAINQQDIEMLSFQEQVVQKQMYLQGMQGLREFAMARDPRRLSGVLTQFLGVPVAIQPRSDGNYNYFVNGQRLKSGVSAGEIASTALREFSPEARAAVAESARLENELALKQKYGDATVNAIKEIQKTIIDGEYKVAVELAKKQGLDVKPDAASGKWAVIRDNQTLYIVDPAEVKQEKTPQGTITTPPPARQIPGLTFTGR
jgi:hypothetical protein